MNHDIIVRRVAPKMLATAREQGCRYLLSEDMPHGRNIDEVQISKPFIVQPSPLGLVNP